MIRFFIIALTCSMSLCSGAQKQKTARAKLTQASTVMDTAGNILPADLWQQMAMNSNFTLRPVEPENETSVFVIRHLSATEKAAMMERLPKPRPSKSFRTGKPLGSFAERDLDGNLYKIKELAGKVIVINFWFINCPPCRTEIPELNALVSNYANNKEVVFLGIALDDKWALQRFLKMMPFQYNIIDNGTVLARKFNVTSFPTHVVVDKEGLVQFHTAGLAKNTVHWVQKSIDEALAKPTANAIVTTH